MALGSHRAPHTQAGASTPTRGSTHAPKTPNPTPSKPKKPPLTPGRVQRLLANAGTRASLPDQYLPAAQLAQRRLNRRLAAPVTAGSSLTERDLARQTRTAADVRYGAAEQQGQQNVAQAQQVQRDTGDYYDAYLRELAAHQRNVAGYQQQAQSAVQGLSAAGTGLGSGAAQGLTGENASVAQNASSVRKVLTDSFGAMLASQGANANTYASNQANVVGPGQKLQALGVAQGGVGKARQQLGQLVKERGAFRQQLAGETRQSEAKNVLAQQIAGVSAQAGAESRAETRRSNRAREANQSATAAARQAEKDAGVNKYGYTSADWQAMSTSARQKIIRQFAAGKPKTTKPTRGPGSLNAGAEAKIVSQARRAAALIKSGPTRTEDADGKKLDKPVRLTDQEIRQMMLNGDSPLGAIDPNVVNIAFDLARRGGLSPANIRAAHALNIHVGGNFKRAPKPKPLTGSWLPDVLGQGGA